jgi:hypothetical protein
MTGVDRMFFSMSVSPDYLHATAPVADVVMRTYEEDLPGSHKVWVNACAPMTQLSRPSNVVFFEAGLSQVDDTGVVDVPGFC